ncbi:hypothetical protein HMPREF1317_1301 [Schaalia georgiae F0490]|uniref:Uncharacterized protein n=1 Tax=Schaalia georgiae F0490 TaxID=1125717 RepID=J0WYG8_9ACTO|nr:hypothetical protein HMPREF1317_1301 [Schaalia georgiae F0490]
MSAKTFMPRLSAIEARARLAAAEPHRSHDRSHALPPSS